MPVKFWSNGGGYAENPKMEAFLREVISVSKKHGLWLWHEDHHGAFQVATVSSEDWLLEASDRTEEEA